jgi:hypothetical protein
MPKPERSPKSETQMARLAPDLVFVAYTYENWPSELGKDLQRWTVQRG